MAMENLLMTPRRTGCVLALALAGCGGETLSVTEPVTPSHSFEPIEFDPHPLPESGRLAVFRPHFDRYVEVFGVHVVATPSTDADKVRHAATILAEWIDNDDDGAPDDPAAHAALVVCGCSTPEKVKKLSRSRGSPIRATRRARKRQRKVLF